MGFHPDFLSIKEQFPPSEAAGPNSGREALKLPCILRGVDTKKHYIILIEIIKN
jgi:hypothetical protein